MIFGDRDEREAKKMQPRISEINTVYESLESLSDIEIRNRVQEIKKEIQDNLTPLEDELEDLSEKYQTEADENNKINLGNNIDRLSKNLKEQTQSTLNENLAEVFAIVKDK